jgi:ABC-type lipoprotein export system ATPase subunit
MNLIDETDAIKFGTGFPLDFLCRTGPEIIIGGNGTGKTTLIRSILFDQKEEDHLFLEADQTITLTPNELAIDLDKEQQEQQEQKEQQEQQERPIDLFNMMTDLYDNDDHVNLIEKFERCVSELLPGAPSLEYDDSENKIIATYYPGGRTEIPAEYPSNDNMPAFSSGGRRCIYIIISLLLDNKKVVVVDEPDQRLNSSLSQVFWHGIQQEFPEKKFIFITHDLHFARTLLNGRCFLLTRKYDESLDSTYPAQVSSWAFEWQEIDFSNKALVDSLVRAVVSVKPTLFVEGTTL